MPEIRAIHGLRYDLGHIGSLAEVISPPAEDITHDVREELYRRHPANVVRVLTNREEPGDDVRTNRFSRASRFVTNWQRQGVLRREPDPAIYVYHQEFESDGQTIIRRGFLAGKVLSSDPELLDQLTGKIAEWESLQTSPNPLDEFRMLQATGMNVQPAIAVYADAREEVQQILENEIATMTPLVAMDDAGVIHRVWPVTDHQVIGAVREAIAHRPARMFLDGPELATLLYRQELQQTLGSTELPSNHPAQSVLTAFFSLTEPGFHFSPKFSLFQNTPRLSSEELTTRLEPYAECIPFGGSRSDTDMIWEQLSDVQEPGLIALYCFEDDQWVIASPTDRGMERMDDILPERPAAWKNLDSSVLEWLILLELLEISEPGEIPTKDIDALRCELRPGNATRYSMAAMVRAPSLSQIEPLWKPGSPIKEQLALDPKPACGLVFNPLS